MRLYQVDAFANEVFSGNPAAVIRTADPLSEELMLQIAIENNLSETAYLVLNSDGSHSLRWYTPGGEVDLCGHATLASAHVLATELALQGPHVFHTNSGMLTVSVLADGSYLMDLPADDPLPLDDFTQVEQALGISINELHEGSDDYLAILGTEDEVRACTPDFRRVAQLPKRGLIISATGEETDFASRCFYPAYAIDEDPVTGSAHTILTPYWSMQLRKNVLSAQQLSARGGSLTCIYKGARVALIGRAVTYLRGDISL